MLSQTIEYALRAMTFLAGLDEGVSANSETIAGGTKVPQGYLSKVLRDLVVAELVISQRGPNGGFCLARPPKEVSMLDVINAVDPLQRIRKCPLGNPAHINLCPLHARIDRSIAMIEKEFKNTSLGEILASTEGRGSHCKSLISPTVSAKKS